jgi:CheY-like chemotaxis protein
LPVKKPERIKEQIDMANVMVVEDSPDARLLLRDLLEGLHHTVTEANDGLEAVKKVADQPARSNVLDLMMPTASGDSALQFMRGTPELADIPVLVVSAHPDVAWIAKQHGADAWVSKPITIKELSQKVEAVLASKRKP